jgi:hypothetical protein
MIEGKNREKAYSEGPRLPVLDGSPEICHLELFMLGGRLSISFQTT